MRKTLICANWKMNKNHTESIDYFIEMLNNEKNFDEKEIVIFPNFVSLAFLHEIREANSNIKLGVQNIFHEIKGAFTGETSPEMIKDICEYVLIGHSERRNIFSENEEMIHKKINFLSSYRSLTPILCIGESIEIRDNKKTNDFLKMQIESALIGMNKKNIENIVIAYEPCWAISNGELLKNPPNTENIEEVASMIRNFIGLKYGKEATEKIRILYGGSVSEKNAKEFMLCPNIDGLLIGSSSLDVKQFQSIIALC